MEYTVDKDTFTRVIKNAAGSKKMALLFEFWGDSLHTAFDIRSQIKHVNGTDSTVLFNGFEFHMKYCLAVSCLGTDQSVFVDEEGDEGSYCMKVGSRDQFDQLLLDLENLTEIVLDVTFGAEGSFTVNGSEVRIVLEEDEEGDYIEGIGEFDSENKKLQVRWKSDSPAEVYFPVQTAEGYWGTAVLPTAGSVEALNAVRKFIDRSKALIILDEENYMSAGSARRGRKTGNPSPEVVEAPAAATAPVEEPKPTCMGCGDTGKNSKGGPCGPCVTAGRITVPAAPPVATPAPAPATPAPAPAAPAAAPAPPAAPQTTTEPPIATEPAEAPTTSPEDTTPEPPKKVNRRTKEEIFVDKAEKSMDFLRENKDSEGLHDDLRVFAKQILEGDGYRIVRPDDAPDTLEGNLDELLTMLSDAREKALHAKAQTEGLVTIDQAKQHLMNAMAAL